MIELLLHFRFSSSDASFDQECHGYLLGLMLCFMQDLPGHPKQREKLLEKAVDQLVRQVGDDRGERLSPRMVQGVYGLLTVTQATPHQREQVRQVIRVCLIYSRHKASRK